MQVSFVSQSVQLVNLEDYTPLELIEFAARFAHRSHESSKNSNPKEFVYKLITKSPNPHYAPLEFGKFNGFKPFTKVFPNIKRITNYIGDGGVARLYKRYNSSVFSQYDKMREYMLDNRGDDYIINGSSFVRFLKSILESELDDKSHVANFICDYMSNYTFDNVRSPNDLYPTFVITCSIGIARELLRHRLMSAVQESTRYVRQNNGAMEFVLDRERVSERNYRIFADIYQAQSDAYNRLLEVLAGTSPQFARDVLPLGLATRLIVQFDRESFHHFMKVRSASDAHPDMRRLAIAMKTEWEG